MLSISFYYFLNWLFALNLNEIYLLSLLLYTLKSCKIYLKKQQIINSNKKDSKDKLFVDTIIKRNVDVKYNFP